jgi:hypothetical protein
MSLYEDAFVRPNMLGYLEAFLSNAWPWRSAEYSGFYNTRTPDFTLGLRTGVEDSKAETSNARY